MTAHKLTISGMHCKSCTMLVSDALAELGATNVKIALDERKQIAIVNCDYAGPATHLHKAIQDAGYKVV